MSLQFLEAIGIAKEQGLISTSVADEIIIEYVKNLTK